MTNTKLRLHSHPRMERECNAPDDHVIIDRNVYEALLCGYSLDAITASESCGGPTFLERLHGTTKEASNG
jgi:hypothetical protein